MQDLSSGGLHSALVAIATPKFSTMVAFYQRLLDQASHPFQANRYAEFQLPGLCLALFLPKSDQELEFALPECESKSGPESGSAPERAQPIRSPMSLCLKLKNLPGAIARVKALEQELGIDCRVGEVAIASHGQELYVYDPQGNRIILYQPLQFA